MWLIAAILISVPSVTSACGESVTLDASKPVARFFTPGFPKAPEENVECTWVVSAPVSIFKLHLSCVVNMKASKDCSSNSFKITDADDTKTLCKSDVLSETLKGPTASFTFITSMSEYSGNLGVGCKVSIDPKNILIETIPIDQSCSCGLKSTERIIGGTETTVNDYPWQALLIIKESRLGFCGGSLISNQWVLSASHCVSSQTPSTTLVVLGQSNFITSASSDHDFNILKVIKHKDDSKTTAGDSDIALLELAKQVVFNDLISPICLPFNYNNYDFTDRTGITTGWGQTIRNNEESASKVLKIINGKIIMPSKCTTSGGYKWLPSEITQNMICGIAENGGPNIGDGGDPMVWKNDSSNFHFQLGVTSYLEELVGKSEPTIYARVSKFVDWIVEQTGTRNDFCVKI